MHRHLFPLIEDKRNENEGKLKIPNDYVNNVLDIDIIGLYNQSNGTHQKASIAVASITSTHIFLNFIEV